MYKIAFSGVPAIGKTTLMKEIKNNFNEYIVDVPEAARLVLNSIPIEFKNNRRLVQTAIFTTTYSLEKNAEEDSNKKVLILDRTLFDNLIFSKIYKAFYDEEIEYFINKIVDLYNSDKLKTIDLLIMLQIKNIEEFVNTHINDYKIFFNDNDRKYINATSIVEFYKDFIIEQERILDKITSKTKKFANKIEHVYLDDFEGKTIYEIFADRNRHIINKIFKKTFFEHLL